LFLRLSGFHLGSDILRYRLFTVALFKRHYFFLLAVLAAALNALAVGAPLVPGFRIFSLLPALMRSRLA